VRTLPQALPLPGIRVNTALKLGHATTITRYVGAYPDVSRTGRGELEAVVKACPAGQFYTRGYGSPGRHMQLACRKGSVLRLDQPMLLDAHQETLSPLPEQLTTLASSQP
jgi:hypothetical protein